MDEFLSFIEHHRATLLRYLDGEAPAAPGEPDALSYVQGVVDDWLARFADRELPEPCRKERTFWYALYQLEELGNIGEFTVRKHVDPFERMMLDDLEYVREILRDRSDLPARFFATRPGERLGGDEVLI